MSGARRPSDLMEGAHLMEGRCTARSKQRQAPCRNRPSIGATVCRFHGGAAPQVQLAARARLERLTHPAITRLGELVTQQEFPSTALSAVRDVLDRNGFGAPDAPDAPAVKVKKLVILIQQAPPGTPDDESQPAPAPTGLPDLKDIPTVAVR